MSGRSCATSAFRRTCAWGRLRQGRVGVRTIWEIYVGWFKLLSTTEIYPDQRADVPAALVEAAGPAAAMPGVCGHGTRRRRGRDPTSPERALAREPHTATPPP